MNNILLISLYFDDEIILTNSFSKRFKISYRIKFYYCVYRQCYLYIMFQKIEILHI